MLLRLSCAAILTAGLIGLGAAALYAADAAPVVPPGAKPDADGSYRLTLDNLPAPVREQFLKQAGGNPIRGISMEMRNGKPTYDCDVFINGKKNEVIVDTDGKLLTPPLASATADKPAASADAKGAPAAPADAAKIAVVPPAAKAAMKFRDTFKVDKAALADRGKGDYFILQPGYKLTFKFGIDTLVITVLDETKMIDGVKCRVVEERETKDGKLAEISRNWFAIDKAAGDVYYFGEAVDVYDADGKIVDHGGSWESGKNGAHFGLFLPGKPKVGDAYYQEVAPGVAMDRAVIASVTEELKVPAGTYKNVLKWEESSAIEAGGGEKFFAPEIGLIKDDEFELAKHEMPLTDTVSKAFKAAFPKGEITKVDMDEENGVWVCDIEFRNGEVEQETDIAADGTILEVTLVVDAKAVPDAAMKAIQKAAEGGKITRIEKIDISYETKDGKVSRLAKPVTHFAAEYAKGDATAEVVVMPDGAPVKE